jgi:hypothetical protein
VVAVGHVHGVLGLLERRGCIVWTKFMCDKVKVMKIWLRKNTRNDGVTS